ncbi:hypothetical protein C8R47DRAFT_938479, partial [Mycena vitilis]
FDFVLPTMHAVAHRSQCYLVYDYTVYPNPHVDGEQVERWWSGLGPFAASTRMMGPGHRHDSV